MEDQEEDDKERKRGFSYLLFANFDAIFRENGW